MLLMEKCKGRNPFQNLGVDGKVNTKICFKGYESIMVDRIHFAQNMSSLGL
jgi:hypothetical protein